MTTPPADAAVPSAVESVFAAVAEVAAETLAADLAAARTVEHRVRVARSPWLTPALAARLAKSRVTTVRRDLAQNEQTPTHLLVKLGEDNKMSVRAAARSNPRYPWTVDGLLGDWDDFDVPLRNDTFAGLDVPEDVLEELLRSPLRSRVAILHPSLTARLRAQLIADPSVYGLRSRVRKELLQSPSTTHEEAERIVAAHTDGLASMLWWLWAEHPNADPDWLAATCAERLGSSDGGTIARVACNPATPPAALARIAREHPHRIYALAHPACPAEVMAELIGDPRRETGARDGERPGSFCRQAVATNPATPPEVLARLVAADLHDRQDRYDFALAHARTADQARTVLTLAKDWDGSLADLLDVAAAVWA